MNQKKKKFNYGSLLWHFRNKKSQNKMEKIKEGASSLLQMVIRAIIHSCSKVLDLP